VIKLHWQRPGLVAATLVQNTPGSGDVLDKKPLQSVVRKGMDASLTAIPASRMTAGKRPAWTRSSRRPVIKKLVVYGIATDYCVKATARMRCCRLQGHHGQEFLSRGVAPDTSAKALDEMKAKGITVVEDLDIVN